ncbi:MAG: hypothetical protein Q7S50_00585 [bacterium]|nr:hypothetical protein [bacterium]
MNVVIPKSLEKQVRQRAQRHGVTQTEYVRTALKQAIEAENDMAAEMRLWDETSLRDFAQFAKARNL